LLKILIHGINYFPEQIGIGKYTGEMAAWLAEQGHSVRVVTAPPYYPDWSVGVGYRTWQYRRECVQGVHIWRCPLWVPRSPSGIKRIIHLLSFAFFSLPVMIRQTFWKPDIVMVIEPPLFCAPQAWFTARLSGAKAWLHVQDFEIAAFFGLGFSSSGLLKKCATAAESRLMRLFDQVSTISKSMLSRISRLRVDESRLFFFPNWVDIKHIHPRREGSDLRHAWEFSDRQRIILYAGSMGRKQGLEIVLDAAAQLAMTYPDAVFLMVGEGTAKADLIAEREKRNLHNIVFKPLQPLECLPDLLAMADIHLIIQKRGIADAVMPSKLTGILAAGGYPIITADEQTELGQFAVQNPGIAELIEPENKEALIQAISRILSRQGSVADFNSVARRYAEQHLATDVVMKNLENSLLAVIRKKS
jgi:colanic acid biosynthesis glycosyl transferase WcaI